MFSNFIPQIQYFKKSDGWQYALIHMMFTIKQEDLRYKARLVVNGNVVDASTFNKYSPTIKTI